MRDSSTLSVTVRGVEDCSRRLTNGEDENQGHAKKREEFSQESLRLEENCISNLDTNVVILASYL